MARRFSYDRDSLLVALTPEVVDPVWSNVHSLGRLGRVIYRLIKPGNLMMKASSQLLEIRYRQRMENRLKLQAHALGFSLVQGTPPPA